MLSPTTPIASAANKADFSVKVPREKYTPRVNSPTVRIRYEGKSQLFTTQSDPRPKASAAADTMVHNQPPSRNPMTRFRPRPITSRVNGITIMWACKSANKKVKNGNSVMWNEISEYPGNLSGTQNAKGLGSIFSKLGSIRLLRQKSNAEKGVLSKTLCQEFWTSCTRPSKLPTTAVNNPAINPAPTGLQTHCRHWARSAPWANSGNEPMPGSEIGCPKMGRLPRRCRTPSVRL